MEVGQLIVIIAGTAAGVTFILKVVDYIGNQVSNRRSSAPAPQGSWNGTSPAHRQLETKVAVLEEHMNGIDAAVVVAVKNVEKQIGDFKDQHRRDLGEIKIRLGRIEAKTP